MQYRSIDEPFEVSADAEDLEKKRLREKQYYRDEYYAGQALATFEQSILELNEKIDALLKGKSCGHGEDS